MLAIIPPQKEIVDKKPFWEVKFLTTLEDGEAGAAEHPGQTGQLGQLSFIVYLFSSPPDQEIKENISSLKAVLYFDEAC